MRSTCASDGFSALAQLVWPKKSATRQPALEGAGDVKSEAAERILRQGGWRGTSTVA